jgi:hypothetical protein
MITFYNEKGFQTGNVKDDRIMNTSFKVGFVNSQGDKGGKIFDKGSPGLLVGYVNENGTIYFERTGFTLCAGSDTIPKSNLAAAKNS